jgi:signal transduction histidine kinase
MKEISHTSDLSESDWIKAESLRMMMQPRLYMAWFSALTMAAMALELYKHTHFLLNSVWLLLSLVLVAFRSNVKQLFNNHWVTKTVAQQAEFVNKHQVAWSLSGFLWGISGWLFFTNIPAENLYVGSTILTFVGFFAVIEFYSHRQISINFINLMMGTQVLGAFWYVAYIWHFQGPTILWIHLLSLIAIWVALHIFNNRSYCNYTRNLVLQYRNSNLINSLELKTEQLAHEKQVAMNANEVIQRFYTSAAHDIRQPVYALKLYAEVATEDPDQISVLMPKMIASCEAVNSLFNSLFEFEQINAGHVQVEHQTVDIDEVIDDLENHFKPLAHRKKLEFRTNTISGYLQSDQLLLKRILTCFISNAIKYTEQGGILITVRKRQTMVVFEVWDTGIGIDAVHQSHVFEEFYKVREFSSADEGFGLGLSVVRRLSEYTENSSISVKSRLGKGSVFRFAVPIKIYTPPYIKSRFNNLKALPLVLDFDIS